MTDLTMMTRHAPTGIAPGAAILAPGVLVTVEPGVCRRGMDGVGIEATLVVTEQGNRPPTSLTKDVIA